jgi:hypothetical protein
MYTTKNFKIKAQLKAAVEAWNRTQGTTTPYPASPVTYFQPGPFGGNEPKDGTFCVEGPQYPEPHRWYATCTAKDGVIIKVK